MKSILFFVGSLNLSGGTERVSTIVANEMSSLGYKVSFLSLYDGQCPFYSVNPSITIDSLFENKISFRKNYHSALIKLRRYIKSRDFDIVVNADSILALYTVPACIGLSVRTICWEHFNYRVNLNVKLRNIARHIAAFACDDIVTLTDTDKKIWARNTLHRAEITAIPNPAPPLLTNARTEVRSKILLAAGRLTYQKGYDLLLAAWSLVIKERQDWMLRIVGNGEDKESLMVQAKELGLCSFIQWVPHVSDMSEQYDTADLYVLSSRFEGLPMVLLEAIAHGLPIVSFDCITGPKEIINSSCGWLVPDGNIDMLAKSLIHAFTVFDDAEVYANYSQSAIDKCRTDFSLTAIINKWTKLIEKNC